MILFLCFQFAGSLGSISIINFFPVVSGVTNGNNIKVIEIVTNAKIFNSMMNISCIIEFICKIKEINL